MLEIGVNCLQLSLLRAEKTKSYLLHGWLQQNLFANTREISLFPFDGSNSSNSSLCIVMVHFALYIFYFQFRCDQIIIAKRFPLSNIRNSFFMVQLSGFYFLLYPHPSRFLWIFEKMKCFAMEQNARYRTFSLHYSRPGSVSDIVCVRS